MHHSAMRHVGPARVELGARSNLQPAVAV